MSDESPSDGTAQPINAYRDGDALFVLCGADLSHTCIHCGKPAAGKPMLRMFPSGNRWDPGLRGTGGGSAIGDLIFALLLLLHLASAAAEEKRPMQRLSFKFGLCAAHHRRRKIILRLAVVPVVAGFVVFFLGLHAYYASQNYYGHQITVFPEMAMIASPMISFLLPLCFAPLISRMQLESTAQDWLRITGVKPEFLQTLPPVPKT
jgi:hypothetical protein